MQTQPGTPSSSRLGKVTFLVALLAAGTLVALPAISTFLLSFQSFSMALNSPRAFVGWSNFQELFSLSDFAPSLGNTLLFGVISTAVVFAAGALVAYGLRAIPVRWLRHALCTLLLVPALAPGQLWAQAYLSLFPGQGQTLSLGWMALWCGVKYAGLAALLSTAALAKGNRTVIAPLQAAAAVALGLLALLGLQDDAMLRMLAPHASPAYHLDQFTYSPLMSPGNWGISTAAAVVMLALRAVLLAAVITPVAALTRRLFWGSAANAAAEYPRRDRLLSLAVAAGVVALAAGVLALATGGVSVQALLPVLSTYPIYIALALLGAAANTALCFYLARPLVTARTSAARGGVAAVLLALTAMGAAPYFLGGYVQFRAMGMVNTYYPVLLSGLGWVLGVWPLAIAARAMGVTDDAQWMRRMGRPALALFAVTAALRMNDALPSMIYLQQPDHQHPLQLLSSMFSAQTFMGMQLPLAAASALLTLVTMALPVILLLLMRTVLTGRKITESGLPAK